LKGKILAGIGFLGMGSILAAGTLVAGLAKGFYPPHSVELAAFGLALGVIGALILTIVPGWQAAPQDAFKGLLRDSVKNVEAVLEESRLRNRAYFLKMADGDVRAFVPAPSREDQPPPDVAQLHQGPLHFVVDYKGLKGMLLIPPGNEIVKLAKVAEGNGLEDALRSTLVDYADLAEGVLTNEDLSQEMTKIQITRPLLSSEAPYFNDSLGSPVSCVAMCVAAVAKGVPVLFVEEKYDSNLIHLTLKFLQPHVPVQS
jgi:hypothetical protein